MDNTGYRLASVLTQAMRQAPFIPDSVPYAEIEAYVYRTVQSIANEQIIGDWLETPTGCAYTLTYKPTKN
jgi:hypothetical protein